MQRPQCSHRAAFWTAHSRSTAKPRMLCCGRGRHGGWPCRASASKVRVQRGGAGLRPTVRASDEAERLHVLFGKASLRSTMGRVAWHSLLGAPRPRLAPEFLEPMRCGAGRLRRSCVRARARVVKVSAAAHPARRRRAEAPAQAIRYHYTNVATALQAPGSPLWSDPGLRVIHLVRHPVGVVRAQASHGVGVLAAAHPLTPSRRARSWRSAGESGTVPTFLTDGAISLQWSSCAPWQRCAACSSTRRGRTSLRRCHRVTRALPGP